MAESIARHDAADLMIPSSAGLAPLGYVQPLSLQTLETNGYPTDGLASKSVDPEVFAAAALVINMSGYPRESSFTDPSKVEDWTVSDAFGEDASVYQEIFEDIRNRINELAARLRTAKNVQPRSL
jgi:protein-tyrosine-phosphatase